MSRFNLIDERWIPVRLTDGSREELGIRDTLLRSREIAAIEDPSPLVTAALHRFLLAVLYRALEGPTDIDQAKAVFKAGLPGERVTTYLKKWRDRFWLFDERYPFAQNRNVADSDPHPWVRLTAENNPTKNKVLFDHTTTTNPSARKPKECARWLVATMDFSISGGRGYFTSPLPNGMMCIPLGSDLHRTLCYCLVPYNNREVMSTDSALWEREPEALPLKTAKRHACGYADLYLWPARMVLLDELPSGEVLTIRFVAGQGFDESGSNDPMRPYRIDKTRGRQPVGFKQDRATWRSFDSLLPDSSGLAPLTIEHAVRLAGGAVDRLPTSILVLGLRYEPPNANVDFWRLERFALPQALARNNFVRTEVSELLQVAEGAQKSLWEGCRLFARDCLSRGKREPEKKDLSGFVEQMAVSPWYWSRLESRFHEVLGEYTLDRNPDDIRRLWLTDVRDALRTAWDQHRAAVAMGDAWTIRAVVRAERPIYEKTRELGEEIAKLTPKKEVS